MRTSGKILATPLDDVENDFTQLKLEEIMKFF